MKPKCVSECDWSWLKAGAPTLPVVALALLPKCPVCLAVYFGFAAMLGLSAHIVAWLFVILLGTLGALILSGLFSSGRRSGRMIPFLFGAGGLMAILTTRVFALPAAVAWAGLSSFCWGCILAGKPTKS
jgi:hypothetical protein